MVTGQGGIIVSTLHTKIETREPKNNGAGGMGVTHAGRLSTSTASRLSVYAEKDIVK